MAHPASPAAKVTFGPFETAIFEHKGRQYHATLDAEGRLKIEVNGRVNGRLRATEILGFIVVSESGPSAVGE